MNSRFLILIVVVTLFLSACSRIPSWVIPQKKMENLLYDIHMAEAEIENDYGTFNDSIRKRELFNAVFEKYHTTEAEFDTSLVWYASNLDLYAAMYDHLLQRYVVLNDTLNARLLAQNELDNMAKRLWGDDSVKVLRPFPSENRYVFRLDSSSSFASGDMYELKLFALGVNDKFRPKVTFVWQAQDTLIVKHEEIKANGTFVMYLPTVPGRQTLSLSGSVRVPMESSGFQLILNDLNLYKYKEGHYPAIHAAEAPADSLTTPTDSVSRGLPLVQVTDSLRRNRKH